MSDEKMVRQLRAVLSADAVGYSRLMRDDEEATIHAITTYRKVITALVLQYRGRVVDSPGDNILAEFNSVVDAVNCAVEIQREVAERNQELSEGRRMEFRIGLNLGDVVREGDRIYGDGLNIAARMEGLAESGGICISGTVYDAVESKIGLEYEFLGEQQIKNIDKPVRVYRVLSFPGAAAHRVVKARKALGKTWRNSTIAIAAVLVAAVAAAMWHFYFRPPPIDPAALERMVYPLPEKASIAVLPFKNISGDPEQEFLTDGITESIIGSISRVSGLFVIASNSVFTYKGKAVKTQTVSQELGVRNVLEGTVQRIGKKLRVNAQLIDALTGRHLWSEKYDREITDIFSVQDNISKEILTALRVNLVEGEQARVWARGTPKIEAYLKFLKAYEIFKSFNKKNMIMTRQLCQEAIALDANYAEAHTLFGVAHLIDLWFQWGESPRNSMAQAVTALRKALSLDPLSDFACANLGHLYLMQQKFDEALVAGRKSIELNPNGDYNMVLLAMTLMYSGQNDQAINLYKKAWRLNPYCPAWYIHAAGVAYRNLGKWDEAIAVSKRALEVKPDHFPALMVMASTYEMSGRLEEGRAVATEMLRINPNFCVKNQWLPYKNKAEAEAVREALRQVGIPETPPLPLPDKPSVAVLPFTNISGDPDQDFFSDGITEEIITALSKVPQLFVIASNSSFTYKGEPVKIQRVGQELGVRYVVEGSVRRAGDRVRITAQLIDALSGHHLWSERYDRELKDIFAIQDEITKKIITALQIHLTEGEQARVYSSGTDNLEAYLKIMEANWLNMQASKEGILKARKLAQEAIALDPKYAFAYKVMGTTHCLPVQLGTSQNPRESLKRGMDLFRKAIELDDSLAMAHISLGFWSIYAKQYDIAGAEAKRGLELQPNSADVVMGYAATMTFLGTPEEAIPYFNQALRLNPKSPSAYLRLFAIALRDAGHYEQAIGLSQKATRREPNDLISWVTLTSVLSLTERQQEAQAAAKEVLRINPKFTVSGYVKPQRNQAAAERLRDALLTAGLPE